MKKDENGIPIPKEINIPGKVDTLQTYPNQKIITVCKEPCDEEHIYAKINIQMLLAASRALKNSGAYRLWTYFATNQDLYTFALSSSKVEEDLGISKKQYDNGIKELIDKRFLVLNDEDKNWYFFKERQVKKINSEEEIKQQEKVPCIPKVPLLYPEATTPCIPRVQEILHDITDTTYTEQCGAQEDTCNMKDSLPSNIVDFNFDKSENPTSENPSTDDEFNPDDLTIPQELID